MVYFLSLTVLASLVAAYYPMMKPRDYGLTVVFLTITLGSAFILGYKFDPQVPSTYILDPGLFSFAIITSATVSGLVLIAIGFIASFYQAKVENRLRQYNDADTKRQYLAGTRSTSASD